MITGNEQGILKLDERLRLRLLDIRLIKALILKGAKDYRLGNAASK